MERKIYVIGHRNPDTDSIVSAIAYAELKQRQGWTNCLPARAGKLTPQTEYILQRFHVPAPEFIPDLVPKVAYFLNETPPTAPAGASLWDALELMDNGNLKLLPVVDAQGRYQSVLNYNAFARNVMRKINPHRKAIIPTSLRLLISTLKAQPILTFGADEVVKSRILVAGSSTGSFVQHLEAEIPANALVLTGDREEVQRLSIERGVRALIITNGTQLAKGLKELAEQRGVSVMVSPYDTSSTAFLILYSTPVEYVADETVKPVRANDYVRNVRGALSQSVARCLPVVDDDNRVVGVLSEGDLIREPNIELVMVDHNEVSQAVEGVENYRILEIIDHHRLGNFATKYPILFVNRVVGATATIVAGMYIEQKAALTPAMASILLAGILADTLRLQSATTTPADREMAEYLANLVDLDVQELGRDIMGNTCRAAGLPAPEILKLDSKIYEACGRSFAVSQVEVNAPEELIGRKQELLDELRRQCQSGRLYFAAVMITDITELNSLLLIEGDRDFIARVAFPRVEEHVYLCKDILSRKKQLVPLLIEQIEELNTGHLPG